MQTHRHWVRPLFARADKDSDMLQNPVRLAKTDKPGILGLFKRNRTVADVSDLDPNVSSQRLDLIGRHSQHGPISQSISMPTGCIDRYTDNRW